MKDAFLRRVGLLLGAAFWAFAQNAEAAKVILTPPKAPAAQAPDDGLRGDGLYLEADTLTSDEDTHRLTAKGAVEARWRGRVLRADELDYDNQSGIVNARGHVVLIDPDGNAQYAEALSLKKDQTEGFALGFATRLQDEVKIAAASARRVNADITEFDQAVYTPCVVCADNGGSRPTWSISAAKVNEDRRRHRLVFHRATVRVLGLPLLPLPIFSAPDPSATRRSGMLPPYLTVSGRRGFSYQQPYYIVLSPSADLTLTPQINSLVYPFLNAELRKRTYSGFIDLRAGYTYDRDFTSGGERFGNLTSRSYVLANGAFDLGAHWKWGFTAERTSDKTLFDKYSISDVFIERGLYAADDRRLISQIYTVRQDDNSYLSVAAISIQGVRPNDQQSTIPTIAPLIEGHYEPNVTILQGRLRFDGSAVVLTRDQSALNPGVEGVDSRRATAGLQWRSNFTTRWGLRLSPFINGRLDVYNLADLEQPLTGTATLTRTLGTAGFLASYPLVKASGPVTYILEPMVLAQVGNNAAPDPRISNEDSQVFEFDETNLFSTNRSPGYDIYEGGVAMTVGGRTTAFWGAGQSASLLFGKRFATRNDLITPTRTGLAGTQSDYLFAGDVTPWKGLRLFARTRLDSDTLRVNRLETGADLSTTGAYARISYLQEAAAPSAIPGTLAQSGLATAGPLKSLDMRGEFYPLKHFGVTGQGIVDSGVWRRREFGLIYRDNCLRFEVIYRHDQTYNGAQGPSTSVVFRISLATLGNLPYR